MKDISKKDVNKMTLQQQALRAIEHLPDEQKWQVIQFAKFLSSNSEQPNIHTECQNTDGKNFIRKPGILKRKMIMDDDFDETPICFKEYM